MEGLFWIMQGGLKYNHKSPCKRQADLTGIAEGNITMKQDATPLALKMERAMSQGMQL